ncbi:MAG: hypothetical protein WAL41_04955 [Mycobacterium sp.]
MTRIGNGRDAAVVVAGIGGLAARPTSRASRLILAGIFPVIATLLVYKGAQLNVGHFPYRHGGYTFETLVRWLAPLGVGSSSNALETTFILVQLSLIMGFLVLITYSKHLHVAPALVNVLFPRRQNGVGLLEPRRARTPRCWTLRRLTPGPASSVEGFTGKGLPDIGTCTECGRRQHRSATTSMELARRHPVTSRCPPLLHTIR